MTIATGSRTHLGYQAEVTWGVAPASPDIQLIDFTSFTGALNTTTLSDSTIRPNRMKAYARRGNVSTEGEISAVLRPVMYQPLIEAALMGTISTGVVKVGTTRRSFTIQQGFTDIAQYRTFLGSMIETFSMNCVTDELVTVTFGFKGKNTTAFSGTAFDTTPTAVTTYEPFYHEGGTFLEGGSAVANFTDINFELNNSVEHKFALGTTGAFATTEGTASVTGKVIAHFQNATIYNKFVNNTDTSINFTLTNGTNTVQVNFPKVKYTAGAVPVNDDASLTVEMDFESIDDGTNGIMVVTFA